ncbi:MAG: bifunctional riboflavin kinase/FAD synthetase [Cyanobacteriota bacterium]|nr:bifunctional riboflavin kinase/FAD synthetase [Cyanobacteriota bacterium]
MHITSDLAYVRQPARVAIGNFDGVHRGHQQVLSPILQEISTVGIPQQGVKSVLTFHPHPQEILTGAQRALLTPLPEKLEYLERLGVEQVVLLPFTPEFACLNADDFMEKVLRQGLGACQISVGWDFSFAYQRSGTVASLVTWGNAQGITIAVVPETQWQGERVSSSRIRIALTQGEVPLARDLLGRPYRLVGEVVAGDQRGRQLGFPTANLCLPPEKFLPSDGVYAGWTHLPSARDPIPSVMNIGVRPTVDGLKRQVEVHLLQWQGDLYGLTLRVDLQKFLRPEQKFASLAELQDQIARDSQKAWQELASPLASGKSSGWDSH